VVCVNAVVMSAQKDLLISAGPGVEVTLRLAAGLPAVRIDVAEFEQSLHCLVANAREAMEESAPAGREVVVETRRGDGCVLVSVTDSGCGMDADTRRRIFEPLFTTRRTGRGVGLGLATVHAFVHHACGSLEVDSAPGRGARLTIHLPQAEARVPASPLVAEPPRSLAGSETVLLVDDEDAVRDVAEQLLDRLGYRVVTAPDAESALRHLDRDARGVDVVLTDVVMPRMGGRELADRIRSKRPATRIVFMSGYTDGSLTPEDGEEQGPPVLMKPFTSAALAKQLRDVLGPPATYADVTA
jgi:two-component system cell cycle sensor histidine kinase/response regulator CckA